MRRLRMSVTGIALLGLLGVGCGSSANDSQLVLRFEGFNGTGITQMDAVGPNNADVDVVQDLCQSASATGGLAPEPFTQTLANVVFLNEEKSDIRLTGYTVDVGPHSGIGVFKAGLSAVVIGGRCGLTTACATDADCQLGPCLHDQTTISSILLFDFNAKSNVIPGTYTVEITFFGTDDADHSFTASASYVVRFDDFNNCPSSGSGAGLS